MAAKRKLWKLAVAHALLVSVPLYGSLPELTEIKRNSRRLVDESEPSLARSAAHRASLSSEDAHWLELFVVCELAPARAVGAEKPLFRGRDFARGEQPPSILEVTCEIASGDCVWRNAFTYDNVGNRTRQDRVETSGQSRTVSYGYDERDRLLSESSTDSTAYGWDENGNLVSKSGSDGASYEWDFDNRLTKVTVDNGTVVEHVYDADGTRVRTTTTPAGGSAERVNYLVDPEHRTSARGGQALSQVVAETDSAGLITALYVRGGELLSMLRPVGSGVEGLGARYFHAEGIGSIRALTNDVGAVTERNNFDAFGALTSSLGAGSPPDLFAGERRDAASGLYSLRARWLRTEVGRFLSMDEFEIDEENSQSTGRYSYAINDPVLLSDPSGLIPVGPQDALFGIAVHSWLSTHFLTWAAGNERAAVANRAVRTILRRQGIDRPAWPWGIVRPDLTDLTFRQIYEIKPAGDHAAGRAQLLQYLALLNAYDPVWTTGGDYRPPVSAVIGPETVAFTGPVAGVITYQRGYIPEAITLLIAMALVAARASMTVLQGQIEVAKYNAVLGAP